MFSPWQPSEGIVRPWLALPPCYDRNLIYNSGFWAKHRFPIGSFYHRTLGAKHRFPIGSGQVALQMDPNEVRQVIQFPDLYRRSGDLRLRGLLSKTATAGQEIQRISLCGTQPALRALLNSGDPQSLPAFFLFSTENLGQSLSIIVDFSLKKGYIHTLNFVMMAENIKLLRERIERKCREVNRDCSEIKLIAVSKTFGIDEIQNVYELGQRDFGENKAQELADKFEKTGDKITWHFIGHLQRNKVRFVVPAASYIHSVDSLQLASEINKYAVKINKIQKILLQMKTSYEESKSGIQTEDELFDLARNCTEFSNVELIGLMTIAPFTDDENVVRQSFRQLRKLRDDLKSGGFKVDELSMGMTSDFEIAIEEGATMLRIGSAIFGDRSDRQPHTKNWKES